MGRLDTEVLVAQGGAAALRPLHPGGSAWP